MTIDNSNTEYQYTINKRQSMGNASTNAHNNTTIVYPPLEMHQHLYYCCVFSPNSLNTTSVSEQPIGNST